MFFPCNALSSTNTVGKFSSQEIFLKLTNTSISIERSRVQDWLKKQNHFIKPWHSIAWLPAVLIQYSLPAHRHWLLWEVFNIYRRQTGITLFCWCPSPNTIVKYPNTAEIGDPTKQSLSIGWRVLGGFPSSFFFMPLHYCKVPIFKPSTNSDQESRTAQNLLPKILTPASFTRHRVFEFSLHPSLLRLGTQPHSVLQQTCRVLGCFLWHPSLATAGTH